MNVKEKLTYFSKIAMREAVEKKNDITKDISREFDLAIDEVRKRAERMSEERIRNEKYKIEQMKNKEVMQAATEAKIMLINLRNRLTDQIFAAVEEKVKQFMLTEEYEHYLVTEIGKQSAGQKDIIVKLMPQDMRFAEKITRQYGIPVEETREDCIGGFMLYIPKKNGMIDYSFKTRLKEERDSFNIFKIPERGGV